MPSSSSIHRAIGLFLVVALLITGLQGFPCAAPNFVDSYTSLPPAPVFPTTQLSASLTPTPSNDNPLTQNHWSEVANLAAYRPTKLTPVADPTTSDCPHLRANLKNWHDPNTWGGSVPANGADITIPANTAVLISSCSIDPTFVFGVITIPAGSTLIAGDAPIDIKAIGFNVQGALYAGSETCRLRNKVSFTLYGSRNAQALPADPWIKGMGVTGSIDLHGVQYTPTWTRLAMTARINDKIIFIQDVVNWQPGQKIVITTTELKDSRDFNHNEEKTIVSVKTTTLGDFVTAIELDSPLTYQHYGGREYQAEVALLSRNIVVQGDPTNSDPTDTANPVCTDPSDGSTYPCEDSYLTGFGAHIFINTAGAQGRFSGVELTRVGQTNVIGRYPIHYHLLGDITPSNYKQAYIQDCSVHHSYFRCYAVHGTSGVRLTENTAYDAIGHCYFLEDGVEENNTFEYNQAAHVHALGPYVNPSIGGNGDSWYGQYLATYGQTDKLILPSDMAAGCFYITNTFNDFYGNAASGGWSGFAIPSLPLPVKLFKGITNMSPANRPLKTPFRGNSAHSSGFWWQTAGGIYVGGTLSDANTPLQYTSGRSTVRDTCIDPTAGTPAGSAGCYDLNAQRFLRFEDNKVFLANRGMQNWGNRAEIIRFELHDVSLAMNVFGQVWIDQMLMECRSLTNKPTFLNGCPTAPAESGSIPWGVCNVRDYTFFQSFGGFQWYDVSQQHIVTNSEFRNCESTWPRCVYRTDGKCSNVAVFTSLTHSDQFVPQLMQVTAGIKYTNVTDLWRYSTKVTTTGATVSGRLQNWYDADGSAAQMPTPQRTQIGSARANEWWKYSSNCVLYIEAWKCPMLNGDSMASIILHHDSSQENNIGGSICTNGDTSKPCPVIGQVNHFGRGADESLGLALAVNAKITGPIIGEAGGWFIRFTSGTPQQLIIQSVQVASSDVLLLALPYPKDTTFEIWNQGASWCGEAWAVCRHNYSPVSSITEVRSHFGDAYYWDNEGQTLYLRVVSTSPTFGTAGSDVQFWEPFANPESFSRGGQTINVESYQSYVYIKSSCASNPCAPQPSVPVPPALFPSAPPAPAPAAPPAPAPVPPPGPAAPPGPAPAQPPGPVPAQPPGPGPAQPPGPGPAQPPGPGPAQPPGPAPAQPPGPVPAPPPGPAPAPPPPVGSLPFCKKGQKTTDRCPPRKRNKKKMKKRCKRVTPINGKYCIPRPTNTPPSQPNNGRKKQGRGKKGVINPDHYIDV